MHAAMLTRSSPSGHSREEHQGSDAPPRPRPRAARQGRDEDCWGHLPPRNSCEGAQRGQGVGCRTGCLRQGRQEVTNGREVWGQGVDSTGEKSNYTRR